MVQSGSPTPPLPTPLANMGQPIQPEGSGPEAVRALHEGSLGGVGGGGGEKGEQQEGGSRRVFRRRTTSLVTGTQEGDRSQNGDHGA